MRGVIVGGGIVVTTSARLATPLTERRSQEHRGEAALLGMQEREKPTRGQERGFWLESNIARGNIKQGEENSADLLLI